MELNDYQRQAMVTCMPSSENFAYMLLNLVGEVGKFASKVAKHIMNGEGEVSDNDLDIFVFNKQTGEPVGWKDADRELEKEAGDILWQLSGLCYVMSWTLEDVAQMNLEKLAARMAAGAINGEGDGVNGSERRADQ